jgi:hypothetical protein
LDVESTSVNISLLPADTQAYLVYLRVNNGSGALLPQVVFPNLQTLDLSGNNLTSVNMTSMLFLPNLRVLRLADNTLTSLYLHDNRSDSLLVQDLDLKNTAMESFDSESCPFFSRLETLEMRYSLIRSIGAGGFKRFVHLKILDMRETPLNEFEFPSNVFRGLTQLRVVYSPNYRLCCANTLSPMTTEPRCITNKRSLSSCEDLLRSSAHQIAQLTLSVVVVLGNILCMIIRHLQYPESTTNNAFATLIDTLNLANLMTGVYNSIIAFMDLRFRSHYISYELSWRRGALCKTAGFLSVMSHGVSGLIMVVITLERLMNAGLVSVRRFTKRSAA